ncbi:response regulator transcription factor [Arsenicicoccus piscis]|nr:response regulator transcription factor [Arsenicicoccus piscis]MCH8627884.1 response regulator transcription factor [Arsenicicoccus piscis]
MAHLLLLTNALPASADVLPALGLLTHTVRTLPAQVASLLDGPPGDAVLVDARRDLVAAKSLCRTLRAASPDLSLLVIVSEGGLVVLTTDWGVDDFLLEHAGPAEVEARLRLLSAQRAPAAHDVEGPITSGELSIDEGAYSVRLRGRPLDLTYKEFELLKHLAQHPGRVFTRDQLLQEVWGYDYFGGTRTVDVHVRRLRAKLGPEHEQLIGTVRNVGYRFVPAEDRRTAASLTDPTDPTDPTESLSAKAPRTERP